MIFSEKAGGFMAQFAKLIEDHRGINFATIRSEVGKELSYWNAEIPGKAIAKAEALNGPMTPAGKRVQPINTPGSEVGASTVATWGRSISDQVNASEIGYNGKEVVDISNISSLIGMDQILVIIDFGFL